MYFCSHSLAWHGFALSGFARLGNFLPRCFLASFGCEPGWRGKLVEESSKELPSTQPNTIRVRNEAGLVKCLLSWCWTGPRIKYDKYNIL